VRPQKERMWKDVLEKYLQKYRTRKGGLRRLSYAIKEGDVIVRPVEAGRIYICTAKKKAKEILEEAFNRLIEEKGINIVSKKYLERRGYRPHMIIARTEEGRRLSVELEKICVNTDEIDEYRRNFKFATGGKEPNILLF